MLKAGGVGDAACAKRLQDHVKAKIAPYKYPRSVKFTEALPKTQTGKVQRFRLKARVRELLGPPAGGAGEDRPQGPGATREEQPARSQP